MPKLIPFLLLISAIAQAETVFFSVDGKKTEFYRDAGRHFMISKDCVKKGDALRCDAYQALSKASLRGQTLKGGANPGAVICSRGLGRDVVVGKDEQENENSFCRFSDGSLVSSGSLTYYAHKNDKN